MGKLKKERNKKFGFSASPTFVKEMDKRASDMEMSRSGFIRFLFRFWLQNGEKIKIGE